LAAFLLDMADRLCGDHPPGLPLRLDLPCGRQEVAELLGLTIETVSRQITRLRDEGVIETPERRVIVVRDRQALAELAGGI
jgi:CRP/FNR family transcriptional regulator